MKNVELDKTDTIKEINVEFAKKEWKGIGTKRNCPKCSILVSYKDKWSFIYAVRDNKRCKVCVARENAEKCKELFKGDGNPFYGRKHSNETRRKIVKNRRDYTGQNNPLVYWLNEDPKRRIEYRKLFIGQNNGMYGKHLSKKTKNILSKLNSGKNNPMYGKPTPQGSGNGWANWYKGFHFRSLRELQYYISFVDGKCISCESAQKFRIPYKDYENINRTYQPDFLVDGKFLVEVKPKKLWDTLVVKSKKKAAEKFCKKMGYEYLLVDVDPDSKLLKEKYLNGEIKFVEKYKERFEKYAGIR